MKTEDVTYTCRNCGHTIIRRQQSYDNDYHHRGGGGGGPFIGGLAEAVSEAEAVSVEAALAEEWAEAVVPVLVSKINVIQCPSFEIN